MKRQIIEDKVSNVLKRSITSEVKLNDSPISIELQYIFQIEQYFDSNNRSSLESLIKINIENNDLKTLSELYKLLLEREFNNIYKIASELFKSTRSNEIKASVLQVAIASTEIKYDLVERKKWFRLWYSIPKIEMSFYCYYLYLYHKANHQYYEGNRIDAIKIWMQSLKICRSHNYHRGQFRLMFFIGRAFQDLDYFGEAEFYYNESYKLAQLNNANRFLDRIVVNRLSNKNKCYSFNSIQNEVLTLITNGELRRAKKLSLFACRCRRYEGRNWGAESELILLAWIAIAENKYSRFFKILDNLDDEYMKILVIDSVSKINKSFFDSNTKLHQIRLLTQRLNVNTYENDSIFKKISYRQDSQGNNSDTEKLIFFLRECGDKGLSMEDICLKIWNLNFSPEIHAHKVYLLITKARKYFGSSKSILNTYGGIYKLNPVLNNSRNT